MRKGALNRLTGYLFVRFISRNNDRFANKTLWSVVSMFILFCIDDNCEKTHTMNWIWHHTRDLYLEKPPSFDELVSPRSNRNIYLKPAIIFYSDCGVIKIPFTLLCHAPLISDYTLHCMLIFTMCANNLLGACGYNNIYVKALTHGHWVNRWKSTCQIIY